MATHSGNGTGKNRVPPDSLAKIPSYFFVQRVAGGMAHQRQSVTDLLVGDYLEDRGLLEPRRQRLLERIVEHRVTSAVVEVCQHHGIELGRSMGSSGIK